MFEHGAPEVQIKSFTKALFATKRNASDSDVRFSGVHAEIKE